MNDFERIAAQASTDPRDVPQIDRLRAEEREAARRTLYSLGEEIRASKSWSLKADLYRLGEALYTR